MMISLFVFCDNVNIVSIAKKLTGHADDLFTQILNS